MFDDLLSAIGYVGSSLDKLGPRELRGALGGKPRELLSFVPFSDSLGITDPGDIQTGRGLLHKAGVLDENKSGWGPALAGFATEAALDPYVLLGGGKTVASALTAPSKMSSLKGLRSGFAAVKNARPRTVEEVASGLAPAGWGSIDPPDFGRTRVVGRRAEGLDPRVASDVVGMALSVPSASGHAKSGVSLAPWSPAKDLFGDYGHSLVGNAAGSAEGTLRHELTHGLIDQAVLKGDSRGLGPMARLAAATVGASRRRDNAFLRGVGNVLEETAAHGAAKRGAVPQTQEMARFLLSPMSHRAYDAQVSMHSPLAASAWHAAPGTVAGGAGGFVAGAEMDPDDPVRGALLGALTGAAGGGIASHSFYKPRGPKRAAVLGENASLGLKYDREVPDLPLGEELAMHAGSSALGQLVARQGKRYARNFLTSHGQPADDLFRQLESLQSSRITPESVGLARSDPEWVNNRTFYHGAAVQGLNPQNLDIAKTSPESLYGRGIYTTDEGGKAGNEITKGYAEARAGDLAANYWNEFDIKQKLLQGMQSGAVDPEDIATVLRAFELPEASIQRAMAMPNLLAAKAEAPLAQLFEHLSPLYGMGPPLQGSPKARMIEALGGLERKLLDAIGGFPPGPKPAIYQAQSDFGKILDLDEPWGKKSGVPFKKFSKRVLDIDPSMAGEPGSLDVLGQALVGQDIKSMANMGLMGWNKITKAVQDLGYDAMTHTGGGRWSPDADPHQVVIALNPQKYRRFEQLPQDELARILGGENAAMDPRFRPFANQSRELQDAADYIGPGYDPDRTITEVIGNLPSLHRLNVMVGSLAPGDIGRLIREIPPGSRPLGHGSEAVALKTPGPNPWAIRIGPESSPLTERPGGRPNIPEVVQPIRANLFGGEPGSRLSVEHVPLINTMMNIDDVSRLVADLRGTGDQSLGQLGGRLEYGQRMNIDNWLALGRRLSDKAARRGFSQSNDIRHNPTNFGWWRDERGNLTAGVHDPGAIMPGPNMSFPNPYTPGPPSPDDYARALNMGAMEAVRSALEEGASRGLAGQGVWSSDLPRAVISDREIRDLYSQAFAELMMYNAEHAGVDAPWLRF